MFLTRKSQFVSILLASSAVTVSAFLGPQINLTGGNNAVLPADRREAVLAVATTLMDRSDPGFVAILPDVPNPFVYERRGAAEAIQPEPEPEPERVVFTDQAILERIAPTIRNQITGSLERGGTQFLQMRGGNMVREGSELPVRLPTISDETYRIRVISISARSFVLGLNEARVSVEMPGATGGGVQLTPSVPSPEPNLQ